MSSLELFKGARVLITGHTGFKGSWLSIWMKYLGADVTGISIDVPSEPSHFNAANLQDTLNDYRIDVRDGDALKSLIKEVKPDFVFHLAAQSLVRRSYIEPKVTWDTNTMGTINVLEALRELDNECVAILITSDKCYDNVEWVWGYRETDAMGGADPYSASKGAAELAIRSYIKSFFLQDGNIRIGVGRAGNVIGGGDWAEDRIVPDSMQAWAKNESVILRNTNATRPWQHVLEPLSGYITLAMELKEDSNLHGEPFNFGPPAHQNHSVGKLVAEMGKYWDQVQWDDLSDQYEGPYESGLLKLNCDKALHNLKWQALWGFEETVRETALWYRTYYNNPTVSIENFSISQVKEYMKTAKERGLTWAQ